MLKASAIQFFASQKDLAAALKLTSGAISQWGDVVPEGQAYKLQSITNNALRVDPACYEKQPASKSLSK